MTLYRPKTLDLLATLRESPFRDFERHAWKLFYLMTVIYKGRWDKRNTHDGFVSVNAGILRKVVGRRFDTEAKRILMELGVIETDKHYIVGLKSRGYRFKEPYRSGGFQAVTEIDYEFVSIHLHRTSEQVAVKNLEQAFLRDNLQRTTIHDDAVAFLQRCHFTKRHENDHFQEDYYSKSVEFIQNRELFFGDDPNTGRVFNNVTSLPRLLRPFLRLDGRPLIEIDVANSQPLLLLGFYDGEAERERYKEAVTGGQFYEALDARLEKPYGAVTCPP